MNYDKIYNNLIDKARNRTIKGYYEEHHIIPKCMGGKDSKDNLIKLTGREHFIAHRLLTKIYPLNDSLIFALHMMLVSNDLQERPSRNYEKLKILHAEAMSRLHKGKKLSDKQKKEVSKRFKGKPTWNKGLPKEKNPRTGTNLSEATKQKIAKKAKGGPSKLLGVKKTEEHKRNSSKAQQKRFAPVLNKKGYQVLTPTGFQDFDGVAYKGLVSTLKFILSDGSDIICSRNHKFITPSGEKLAKDCLIGTEINNNITIINIEVNGKRHVYDLLDVKNGNLYLTNNVISHNCELLRDEDYTVIPEFDTELQQEIIKEWPRPAYFDIYVGGDIGHKDYTVFLIGYYDFKAAKLIIEDEVVMRGRKMTTDKLADAIKEKEKTYFINPVTKEPQAPFMRVCDNNLVVINDLKELHGLTFLATSKDDAWMALNEMRIMIRQKRIIIHPRCVTLINHLKYATWSKSKDTFNRSADHGHYDAVDALKYLCRNVQYSKNPYPSNTYGENWWVGFEQPGKMPDSVSPQATQAIKNVFKIRPSLKRLGKS